MRQDDRIKPSRPSRFKTRTRGLEQRESSVEISAKCVDAAQSLSDVEHKEHQVPLGSDRKRALKPEEGCVKIPLCPIETCEVHARVAQAPGVIHVFSETNGVSCVWDTLIKLAQFCQRKGHVRTRHFAWKGDKSEPLAVQLSLQKLHHVLEAIHSLAIVPGDLMINAKPEVRSDL